ncbi:MAG: ribulokinase [Bacteroidota bacterium]
MSSGKYCIGLDFGTDSVRAVLVNAFTGMEQAASVFEYPRWKAGLYCDAAKNQFRQHPLDYIEGLEYTIRECVSIAGPAIAGEVVAISITATGSTPVAVNEQGIPLALQTEFSDNPNAMFLLWKDHSAMKEAEDINRVAAGWEIDYLKYAGGVYSPEWSWAKLLFVLRTDTLVRAHCFTWMEHSDWIPFLLTGQTRAIDLKRNVCAAGHKALWAAEHHGFPSREFLRAVDPLLEEYCGKINAPVFTADQAAGRLSESWAMRLGLPLTVKVGVGAIDAHVGAIGAQIEPGYLAKIIGTSTCDMLVVPKADFQGKFVKGICGQVDGSIIPGMIGLEAGQAAFGDVYSWFKNLLLWPVKNLQSADNIPSAIVEKITDELLKSLDEQAGKILIDENSELAIDWINGRRTPDANLFLKGAITQISIGSDAPAIYAALVEATCFGAKKIIERFYEQGINIKGIIGVGGIARKSPFVMQMMADILEIPIKINKSDQVCATGAAMLAATVAGIYTNVEDAMRSIGAGFDKIYYPDEKRSAVLQLRYKKYNAVCGLAEYGL